MTKPTQSQSLAEAFTSLHHKGGAPLVLVNVWDAASARLVEEAGAKALATSSSAISWSMGFPDGNRLPAGLAMSVLERIVAATSIPVTADIEAGYAGSGDDFDDTRLRDTILGVLDAGAVGIN
ncbi:MAG TPA: isocitrate lyase/phosphoenolpyruvate mutase family protein, partial [Arthrobacter sp.]|nr:isocitrate lyase/phosphoenolpyruvate mutase family protein [Arthrobacter sp.]